MYIIKQREVRFLKKLKQNMQPYMVRPLIYMTFTRFILALTAALLADYFLRAGAGQHMKATVFLFMGIFFAILAWIAYLRLDGIQLPKPMMLRLNLRKKPTRLYGDMIDYVDEEPQPITFEELNDGEKDLCLLGADVVCCVVFVVLSALF